MLDLSSQILRMYDEIASYGYQGHFGDGIDHGDYNPYELIRDLALNEFERTGVSIAILHYLSSAMDNSTWEDAIVSEGRRVRPVISAGLLGHERSIRSAALAFFESEIAFYQALNQVFEEVIRPLVEA